MFAIDPEFAMVQKVTAIRMLRMLDPKLDLHKGKELVDAAALERKTVRIATVNGFGLNSNDYILRQAEIINCIDKLRECGYQVVATTSENGKLAEEQNDRRAIFMKIETLAVEAINKQMYHVAGALVEILRQGDDK